MPHRDAKVGDAYWLNKDATEHPPRVGKHARPMACMADRPNETVWSGLPRVTSNMKPEDRASRVMPEIHATRLAEPGWWSARYIHPVHKNVTGELCSHHLWENHPLAAVEPNDTTLPALRVVQGLMSEFPTDVNAYPSAAKKRWQQPALFEVNGEAIDCAVGRIVDLDREVTRLACGEESPDQLGLRATLLL
jgi:hypothetical protein